MIAKYYCNYNVLVIFTYCLKEKCQEAFQDDCQVVKLASRMSLAALTFYLFLKKELVNNVKRWGRSV